MQSPTGPPTESPDSAIQRQTNYLILRTLEQRLDPHHFRDLISKVQTQLPLPDHHSWEGQTLPRSYEQLRVSEAARDALMLQNLVGGMTDKNLENCASEQHTKLLKQQTLLDSEGGLSLLSQLQRRLLKPRSTSAKLGQLCAFEKLERMKTVFCHSNLETDELSAIYNVYFDQSGSFIISAGDEGIIKVFDRETFHLQASLHGHTDYITEIDISKCNKFIASAGKDAQIIIWELATGKLLYRLHHHQRLINCVKFFTPKPTTADQGSSRPGNVPSHQQYLFSCSDDGTVRLYDLTAVSGWATNKQADKTHVQRSSEEDNFQIRRSNRQRNPVHSTASEQLASEPDQLYSIELTPDDFRPGTRNKKLDTLVINHSGLVVAGASTCELFVWRVNYDLVQKRVPKQDCFRFLGQFRTSRSSCVKFCEFCPRNGIMGMGETLMTGSNDGVVNLWNMSVGQWRSSKEANFTLEDKSRLLMTIDPQGCHLNKPITFRDASQNEQTEYILEHVKPYGGGMGDFGKVQKSVCDAVRWSVNGRFAIASVQCEVEGEPLESCRVKVWDSVEHVFIEDLARLSGIRLPKNTFVLQTHPICEEILVTGSDTGVLAMWNLNHKQLIKQFKQYGIYSVDANVMDNPLHGSWSADGRALVIGNCLGTVCLYAHESLAHQYEACRVQQFFQFDISRQSDNPFEKITQRPSICSYNMMPYEQQPAAFKIRFTEVNSHLTPQQFERDQVVAKQLGITEELFYRDKLQTTLFNDDIYNPNLPMESINQVSAIQPASSVNQNEDADVEMSEVQLIDQLQQRRGQAQQNAVLNGGSRQRPQGRTRLQRNSGQRNERPSTSMISADSDDSNSFDSESLSEDENSLDQSESESNSLSDENDNSEESIMRRGRRSHRQALQRNNALRNENTHRRNPNGRPVRAARPVNLRDLETIQDNSFESVQHQRRRNGRTRRLRLDSPDSDVDVVPEVIEIDTTNNRGATVRQRRNQEWTPADEEEDLTGAFYLSDNPLKEEKDDGLNFDQHMHKKALAYSDQKAEYKVSLVLNALPLQTTVLCHLCKREGGVMVGPFEQQHLGQFYLHKDCLEINTYSYFNHKDKKWANIDTMLKMLNKDAQYTCFRCEGEGASVQCTTCGKCFHGFYCSGLYLIETVDVLSGKIPEGSAATNHQMWICLFCQNRTNNESAVLGSKKQVDKKAYHTTLGKIDKEYLLESKNHQLREHEAKRSFSYQPQIDDVCVYFYQGHEDYICQYSLHFYAGHTNVYPTNQTMPFHNEKCRKQIQSQAFSLCRVVQIQTLFPSKRELELLQAYGKTASDFPQTPQMIQRVLLEFVESKVQITVDLLPNQTPDFLVLYQTFARKFDEFKRESLIGKVVTVRQKSNQIKVKLIEEKPLEPQVSPQSLWKTLVCQQVHPIDVSSRRQQSSQQENLIRLNFWDIVQNESPFPKLDSLGFSEHENEKIVDFLKKYFNQNKEYLIYFKERVSQQIAPSYRQVIAHEMWLDLIYQRLQNKFYRSNRQMLADLDLIAVNASAYNGEKHEVAQDAKELVRRIKSELLKLIDVNGEKTVKQRVDDAVKKLTAGHMLPKCRNLSVQQATGVETHSLEESKDEEVIPTRVGLKRLRNNGDRQVRDDSLEVAIAAIERQPAQQDQNKRTLRKRQRQI